MEKKDISLLSMLFRASETNLLNVCTNYLENKYGKHNVFKSGNNFVYATGDIPILLVAHLDTVLPQPPSELYTTSDRKNWMGQKGLGADDRAGVYAIMKIISSGRKPSILFTTGEEAGGLGAMAFAKEFPEPPVPTKYVLEIDRRGRGQAVYYDCGNKKFEHYITEAGFTTHRGIFSDISFICPQWNIAGVNVSAGYYNEHTEEEYFCIDDLNYSIKCVKTLLDKADEAEFYTFEALPSPAQLYAYCDMCGKIVPSFTLLDVEGTHLCSSCIESFVDWCDECGKPFFPKTILQTTCEECLNEL